MLHNYRFISCEMGGWSLRFLGYGIVNKLEDINLIHSLNLSLVKTCNREFKFTVYKKTLYFF